MPIKSRYSNEQFDALTQDVFLSLEKNNAKGNLAIMVLGNVLANIFQNQVPENLRKEMVEQFCTALTKSATN